MHGEILEYITAVYEAKSFKLAAEKLNVSYSNLIKQISRAEHNLGIKIFDRGNGRQPVTLTSEGRLIIESVQTAVAASKDIRNKAKTFVQQKKTYFNLGLSLMRSITTENKIISNFSLFENSPLINITRDDNHKLLSKVNSGVLDGAFIVTVKDSIQYSDTIVDDFRRFNIHSIEINKCEKPHLIMSDKHPLSAKETISKNDKDELLKYPFIITTSNNGNLLSVDIGLFNYLDIKRKELQIRSIDSSSTYFVPSMLRYSNCLYIDPRFSGESLHYSGLMAVPISGWKSLTTTYFIYSKTNNNNLNTLLEIIKDIT